MIVKIIPRSTKHIYTTYIFMHIYNIKVTDDDHLTEILNSWPKISYICTVIINIYVRNLVQYFVFGIYLQVFIILFLQVIVEQKKVNSFF